jgi:uncharacterized protein
MGRLVVLVLLVVVAVWLVRRALARAGREADRAARGAPDELVRCAHCGIHLPRAEARAAGATLYCSDEHARLGPKES